MENILRDTQTFSVSQTVSIYKVIWPVTVSVQEMDTYLRVGA